MFDWLKRRGLAAVTRVQEEEMVRWTKMLKGMSAEEIGFLIASATVLRFKLTHSGYLPAEALNLGLERDAFQMDLVPMKLTRLVKDFQHNNELGEAAAAMVWLHSVRALNDGELRYSGRLMWEELTRGFPEAHGKFKDLCLLSKGKLKEELADHLYFIPVGLEPLTRKDVPVTRTTSTKLENVETYLKKLGYDPTTYGMMVASVSLESSYGEVDTASLLALTTLALDISEAGSDLTKVLNYFSHGMAMIGVLAEFKDNGLMSEAQFQNDALAIKGVATINKEQPDWIAKILSDPIAGQERLAVSYLKYTI